MSFGKSAKTKNTGSASQDRPTENIFLDTKQGIRLFQLPAGSEEVKIKRHWLAQEGDGTWVPKFGYNPNDKRKSVPITVAVWDSEQEVWIGANGNWRKNPIDQYIWALSEEDRKGKYAQEKFFLNVVDLTPVKIDAEGNTVYPDIKMQYGTVSADVPKQIVGKMRILEGSSSDPDGKSLYADVYRTISGALNDEGDPVEPTEFVMKLTTSGTGKSTVRGTSMSKIAPLAKEYLDLKMYDLKGWLKPWPNDAIQELLDGGDYGEVVKKYNIKLYPDLMTENTPQPGEEDEEGLFD